MNDGPGSASASARESRGPRRRTRDPRPPEAVTDMRGTADDRARFGMPTPAERRDRRAPPSRGESRRAAPAGCGRRRPGSSSRRCTQPTPPTAKPRSGGASALAARWRHRWSTDLDIIVGSETEFARLTEAENPDLWREMRAAGTTTIESEGTLRLKFGARQIEVLGDVLTPATGQ